MSSSRIQFGKYSIKARPKPPAAFKQVMTAAGIGAKPTPSASSAPPGMGGTTVSAEAAVNDKWTVMRLRRELSSRSLLQGGSKDDLLARLRQAIAADSTVGATRVAAIVHPRRMGVKALRRELKADVAEVMAGQAHLESKLEAKLEAGLAKLETGQAKMEVDMASVKVLLEKLVAQSSPNSE